MSRPGSGTIRRTIRPKSGDNGSFSVPTQNHSLEALLPDPPSVNTPRIMIKSEPRASPLSVKRNQNRSNDNEVVSSKSTIDRSHPKSSPRKNDMVETVDAMGEALENARALREAQAAEWDQKQKERSDQWAAIQTTQETTTESVDNDFSIPFEFLERESSPTKFIQKENENSAMTEKRSNGGSRKGKRNKSKKEKEGDSNESFQNKMKLKDKKLKSSSPSSIRHGEFKQDNYDDDNDDDGGGGEYKQELPMYGNSHTNRINESGDDQEKDNDRATKVKELQEYLDRINKITGNDVRSVTESTQLSMDIERKHRFDESSSPSYDPLSQYENIGESEREKDLTFEKYHSSQRNLFNLQHSGEGEEYKQDYDQDYGVEAEDYAERELERRRQEYSNRITDHGSRGGGGGGGGDMSDSIVNQPPTTLESSHEESGQNLWDAYAKAEGFSTKGVYERYQGMLAEEQTGGEGVAADAESAEDLAKGLERIKHLDLLLAAKERESHKIRSEHYINTDMQLKENMRRARGERGMMEDLSIISERPDTADTELSSRPEGDRAFLTEGFLQRQQYQRRRRHKKGDKSKNNSENDDGYDSDEYSVKSTARSKASTSTRGGYKVDRIAENIANAKHSKKTKPVSSLTQDEQARIAELIGDDSGEEKDKSESEKLNDLFFSEHFGDKDGSAEQRLNVIDEELRKLGSKPTSILRHCDPLDVMAGWGGHDEEEEEEIDDDNDKNVNNKKNIKTKENQAIKKNKTKIDELEKQRRQRKISNRLKELDDKLSGLKEAWVEVTDTVDPNQRGLRTIPKSETQRRFHQNEDNNNKDGEDAYKNERESGGNLSARGGGGGLLGEVRRRKQENLAKNSRKNISPKKSNDTNSDEDDGEDVRKQKVFTVSKAEILMVLSDAKREILNSSHSDRQGGGDDDGTIVPVITNEEDRSKLRNILKNVSHEVDMLANQRKVRQDAEEEERQRIKAREQEEELMRLNGQHTVPESTVEELKREEELKRKERRRKRAERKAAHERQMKIQKEALPPAISSLFRSPLIPDEEEPS